MESTDTALTVPWVEKYRPESLDQVIAHQDIIHTIGQFIKHNQIPHLLLHGPPGTGKTSTILAVAKQLYGPHRRTMVLELNASDDRGINVVRETVKTFAESGTTMSSQLMFGGSSSNPDTPLQFPTKIKLVVMDEADQMTAPAQMALRRIMEKYAEHVRFCIICNYVNKINPALQSRCTKFRFPPLPESEMKAKAFQVALNEGIELTEDGCATLAHLSGGDMRRVLNVLQAAVMSNTGAVIDSARILDCVGLPQKEEVQVIFKSLCEAKFSETYDAIIKMQTVRGYSLQDIITAIYDKSLTVEWPLIPPLVLFPRLAEIEHRLTHGADESIQAAALVSAFIEVRIELEKLKFVIQT
eukprot:GHVN01022327.1.p1 GENE.GHVN01022327.1~~GHVN01022327.1.p1  ORF type:complete len:356 (+),score=55.82 GHVN01022327.1:120-1187(+)